MFAENIFKICQTDPNCTLEKFQNYEKSVKTDYAPLVEYYADLLPFSVRQRVKKTLPQKTGTRGMI